ncbi:hypothetical protein LEP1GSC035_2408 [Leptospira noguchii str. 2007001578]|uniref:Uncharacterized protein n=1 Tax=Leptospira noguchii str. 2007001578 TaxID=1049974 RepID=A0ABN0J3P1_9LEPT|nr:hypothetical protein LEP1GSC035_2408 [Leptospira noguchii str. 2007001578]
MIQSTSFTNKGRNYSVNYLYSGFSGFNPLPSQTKEEIIVPPIKSQGIKTFQSTSFTNKGRNTSIPRSKSKRFCFNPLPSQTKEEIHKINSMRDHGVVSIHFLHKQRKK